MSLTINPTTAKRLYDESPDWFKAELEIEFGKDHFINEDFENIKTFEDACAKLSMVPGDVLKGVEQPDEIAYRKLKVIVKAIRGDWKPDWTNSDQRKWFPYFKVSSSGFGFSGSYCDYGYANAYVGSRLCFPTSAMAEYAGSQFKDIYEHFIL